MLHDFSFIQTMSDTTISIIIWSVIIVWSTDSKSIHLSVKRFSIDRNLIKEILLFAFPTSLVISHLSESKKIIPGSFVLAIFFALVFIMHRALILRKGYTRSNFAADVLSLTAASVYLLVPALVFIENFLMNYYTSFSTKESGNSIVKFNLTINLGDVITSIGILIGLYFSLRTLYSERKLKITPEIIAYVAQIDVITLSRYLVIKNTGPVPVLIKTLSFGDDNKVMDQLLEKFVKSKNIWLAPGQKLMTSLDPNNKSETVLSISYTTKLRGSKEPLTEHFNLNFGQFSDSLWMSATPPYNSDNASVQQTLLNAKLAELKEKL